MNNELLVLFGGFIVLLSLRRNNTRRQRRTNGFVQLLALLIDTMVLLIGVSSLTVGLINFMR